MKYIMYFFFTSSLLSCVRYPWSFIAEILALPLVAKDVHAFLPQEQDEE
jgi:hypothetical protein